MQQVFLALAQLWYNKHELERHEPDGMASHEYEIGKEEKKMKKTLIHLGMP